MRKLTSREAALAVAAGLVLLTAATLRWARPRVQEWRDLVRQREEHQRRRREYEHLAGARPDIERRLAALREKLPAHPAGRDVTAELLRTLERRAEEHGLVLLRRDASKERAVEDLREQTIACQWEGDLSQLVRFLFALQSGEGLLDVSQLTVSPAPGGGGRLRGTFTVDFAYTRTPAPPVAGTTAP